MAVLAAGYGFDPTPILSRLRRRNAGPPASSGSRMSSNGPGFDRVHCSASSTSLAATARGAFGFDSIDSGI